MHGAHNHNPEEEGRPRDYLKFAGIIAGIFLISWLYLRLAAGDFSGLEYTRIFMGVFFLVFAGFKLLDLKGFAASYQMYDIIAKRIRIYAYLYPFIELGLGLGYFLNVPFTDAATLVIMAIGAIGVARQLLRGSKIKCACLGTFIKLPLTTVSLIEDLAMGVMAAILLAT